MGKFNGLPHKRNDKRVFKIGQFIWTDFLVEMQYEEEERATRKQRRVKSKRHAVRIKQDECVWGQIVGARLKQEGTYYPAGGTTSGGMFDPPEYDYDPACLLVDKTIVLWEIRQGYLNKPLLAFASDIHPAIGVLDGSVPWRHSIQTPCDARLPAELSKAAKAQPRDSNGKFVKSGVPE